MLFEEMRKFRQLDGAVRNKSIYQKISSKLKEVGYYKDRNQCMDKIKNLKNDYKKAKMHNEKHKVQTLTAL